MLRSLVGSEMCIRDRNFYQNKVQIFLVLIYDHTLVLISPRTLFCIYLSKEVLSEEFRLQKVFKNLTFALVWSTERSTAGRAELLCRSTVSVNRHAPLCMCAHRSTESKSSALCFSSVDRTGRPTERTHSLFGTSVDRLPNNRKSDRWRSTGPVDRQQSESADRFQQLFF